MEHESNMEDMLSAYRNILRFMSESTDDYFFLLDNTTGNLYLPESMRDEYDVMQDGADHCSLEDWYAITYPKDIPTLMESVRMLQTGEKDFHDMEYRVINRRGEIVWISCRGKVQMDQSGERRWMIGRISDTVARNKTDRLTGAFSMDVMEEEIAEILKEEQDGYFLLLDVDDQKSINLKNGQDSGDEILKQVAESLEIVTGGVHKIYRMNGDCFAVNLPGKSTRQVTDIFQKLRSRLEGRCTLSGGCVPFQTYKVPDAGTIFQYAENSLGYAKSHGKDNLRFFSAEDYEKDLAALELKEDLQKSVREGFQGFSLCYQPQVLSHSYRLHGAEALLRYTSPRRGSVSPTEFVPMLEESKLICSVGMWVLDTALEQCRKWREHISEFCVSVNMSYTQLCEPDITDKVLAALKRSGLPGSALTVEITEGMQLLNYSNLNEIFRRWNQFGITVSIDDFGTGYSSLGWLKEMEIDEIKIDRCFVSNIQSSAYNFRLLGNMIELAESSQIRVCCEGVETTEELAVLEELRPGLLQGFLFSKPCQASQFEKIYIDTTSQDFQDREQREQAYRQSVRSYDMPHISEWPEEELVQAIMAAENDVFYVSDLETYELYYLNPAGQKLMGLRDYRGKKCYKALQGRDEPCPFCTNKHLKADDFYIWDQMNDYCGRHFVLKDKLITFRGKQVRMEVALDVTKHEIVSQDLQERLNFANKVVEYTQILSGNADYGTAVRHVLASLGEFYQSDRAYLFEPDPKEPDSWSNTYEWCRSDVTPQMQNLQRVPPEALGRWMELFKQDKSVIIFNLDAVQKINPLEWEVLEGQDINRLIAVPVRINDTLVGFIGIDNPRYSIHDDSQARVLSYFLMDRIRQERNEQRFQELLGAGYRNILDKLEVGLWIIRMDPTSQRCEMLADENMRRIMGLTEALTPEECYRFWYERVNAGYYDYVNQAIGNAIESRRMVQLEYTWKHPIFGEILVQCTGIRTEDQDGWICLSGCHRIISGTDRPRVLEETRTRDVFEYNEQSRNIFFHTDRTLLAGREKREGDFPQCWIERGIVHPHFIKTFRKAFSGVSMKSDLTLPEILLLSKNGSYEWFKLSRRHLGQGQQDLNTVMVEVEPTGAERVQELESMRKSRFYQALLSEAIAYAEVDLESGQPKSLGGLWKEYDEDYKLGSEHFIHVLGDQLANYLPAEEVSEFRKFCSREDWDKMPERGELSRRFSYQRPVGDILCWVELVVHVFREKITRNVYALLYLKDINVEKERAIAQDKAANLDPLTGVYNRTAFERKVTQCVRRAERDPCGVLMLLDIDDFKRINDNNGHLVGDQALREVAQLLRATFRQKDIIGRLGGDEFLVYIDDYLEEERLFRRLSELLTQLDAVSEFPLASSIGVTFVRRNGFDYTRSLGEADKALYYGKQTGKHQFFFYEDLPADQTSSARGR